jgi:hypothetical protein
MHAGRFCPLGVQVLYPDINSSDSGMQTSLSKIRELHGLTITLHTPAIMEERKKKPWFESTSELYRPSDCRLSAKLEPTFADRGCHMVSVTSLQPYARFF